MSPFPDTLKDLRRARGMTQWALARMAGFDHSTLSRWESGDRHPEPENVEALAAVLCVSTIEADALRQSAGYDTDDMAWWRTLPPEVRTAARTLIEKAGVA